MLRSIVIPAVVVLAKGLHGGVEGRHRGADAGVLRTVQQHERSRDLRHRVDGGRRAGHVRKVAVERDAAREPLAVIDRRSPRGLSTPAVSDDGVPRRGGRQRHGVVRHGGDAAVAFCHADAGNELPRGVTREFHRARSATYARQQVGRHRDESVRRHLVCHAAYPRLQSEDLVHHHHHRCVCVARGGIDDPRHERVCGARRPGEFHPFCVARTRRETGRRRFRAGRQARSALIRSRRDDSGRFAVSRGHVRHVVIHRGRLHWRLLLDGAGTREQSECERNTESGRGVHLELRPEWRTPSRMRRGPVAK